MQELCVRSASAAVNSFIIKSNLFYKVLHYSFCQ